MPAPMYGTAHQRQREQWRSIVEAGRAYCAEPLCLMAERWIPPTAAWDLAHDRATGAWLGPAHRRCNRSEGATFKQVQTVKVSRWVL